MAHFAQIDDNNVVIRVIVVDNKELIDPHSGEEDEILGVAFCKKLFGGKWIQTSYNGNFRKHYAGIGYTYNAEVDAFVPPKLFESWIFNEKDISWESPIGPPPNLTVEQKDHYFYDWNDENFTWELLPIES